MAGLNQGSVLISLVAVLFATLLLATIPLAALTREPLPKPQSHPTPAIESAIA